MGTPASGSLRTYTAFVHHVDTVGTKFLSLSRLRLRNHRSVRSYSSLARWAVSVLAAAWAAATFVPAGAAYAQSAGRKARQSFDRGADLENEAAELLKNGDADAAQKRLTSALAAYRAALQQNPADPDPALRIGAILQYEKKCGEALPILVKSAKLAFGVTISATTPSTIDRPRLRELLLLIGKCRLEDGPDDTGFRLLELVGNVDASVHFLLGRRYLQAERQRPALHHLSRYLESNPDDVRVRRAVADLQLRLDQLDEAAKSYRVVLGRSPDDLNTLKNLAVVEFRLERYPQAIRTLRKVLKHEPNDVPARFNLGVCFAQLGQHEQAGVHLRKALALKPDLARAWFRLGQSLAALNRYDEALDAFARTVDAQHDHVKAYAETAKIQRMKGRGQQCVTGLRRALRPTSRHAQILLPLGDCLRDIGRHEDALAVHSEAEQKAPLDAAIQAAVGDDLRALDRLEEAITSYRKSLEVAKKSPTVQGSLAKTLSTVGARALRAGDSDKAIVTLTEAADLRPNDAVDEANLGLAYLVRGETKKASAHLATAISLDGRRAAIACALARLQLGKGESAKAIATLQKFSSRARAPTCVAHLLGLAHLRTQNFPAAAGYLERAFSERPDDRGLRIAYGQALTLAAKYTAATRIFESVDLSEPNPDRAEALKLLVAYAEYRAQRFEKAVALLGEKGSREEAANALRSAAWVAHGRSLFRQRQFREALSAFVTAQQLNRSVPARSNAAATLYQLGKPKTAYRTWKGLSKRHRHPEIYFNVAIYLDDERENENEAYRWYRRYARSLPADRRSKADLLLARKRALFGFKP